MKAYTIFDLVRLVEQLHKELDITKARVDDTDVQHIIVGESGIAQTARLLEILKGIKEYTYRILFIFRDTEGDKVLFTSDALTSSLLEKLKERKEPHIVFTYGRSPKEEISFIRSDRWPMPILGENVIKELVERKEPCTAIIPLDTGSSFELWAFHFAQQHPSFIELMKVIEASEKCCSDSQTKAQTQIHKELEEEIKYFEEHLEELLKEYNGKYIAIKNQEVIAVGNSYGEVSEKVRKSNYRKERCVLIRKVTKERPIHFVPFPLS